MVEGLGKPTLATTSTAMGEESGGGTCNSPAGAPRQAPGCSDPGRGGHKMRGSSSAGIPTSIGNRSTAAQKLKHAPTLMVGRSNSTGPARAKPYSGGHELVGVNWRSAAISGRELETGSPHDREEEDGARPDRGSSRTVNAIFFNF